MVVGSGIAVGAGRDGIGALDSKTGATLWSTKTSQAQSWASSGIAIGGGLVFMATNHGLYALDKESGEIAWHAKHKDAEGSPLIFEEHCLVGARKGLFAQSLAKKGRKAWSLELKDQVNGAPAFDDGVLYYYGDTLLHAFDTAEGRKLWEIPAARPSQSCPIVTDDSIIHIPKRGYIGAADRGTGEERWMSECDTYGRTFAASSDTLVVKDYEGLFHAFELATGDLKWSSPGGRKEPYGIGSASPIIVGQVVVCVTVEKNNSDDRFLTGLGLKDGSLLWDLGPVSDALAEEQKKNAPRADILTEESPTQ